VWKGDASMKTVDSLFKNIYEAFSNTGLMNTKILNFSQSFNHLNNFILDNFEVCHSEFYYFNYRNEKFISLISKEPMLDSFSANINQNINLLNTINNNISLSDNEEIFPIFVNDRLWGIYHVTAKHGFTSTLRVIFKKMISVIGDIVKPLSFNLHVSNLLSLDFDINKILPICCKFIQAEASSVWVKQNIGEFYECKSQHNRPSLSNNELVAKNDHLKSLDIDGQYLSEIMGEGNHFDEEWFMQSRNEDLRTRGFKTITVIPIKNETDVVASISFYSKSNKMHDKAWEQAINVISGIIKLLVLSFYKKLEEASVIRSSIIHETKNTLPLVEGATSEIYDIARKTIKANESQFSLITTHMNEFKHHIKEISGYMGERDNEKNFIENAYFNAQIGNVTNVDIIKFIKYHTNPQQKMLRKNGLRLIWKQGRPTFFKWRANRSDINHILVNLLVNAIKYNSTDTHKEILLSVDQATSYSRFSIQNVGRPIDEEEWDKIWRYGFRGSNSLKTNIRGNGLGLYYVRKIAEAYGWNTGRHQRPLASSKVNNDLVWHEFYIGVPSSTFTLGNER